MAKSIDKFFVTTGIMSTAALVFLLTLIRTAFFSSPSFVSFVQTFFFMEIIFIFAALVVSVTTWTEKPRNAFILAIIVTLLSVVIYNFIMGGIDAVWTSEIGFNLTNWGLNIALVVVVTLGVFYVRYRKK